MIHGQAASPVANTTNSRASPADFDDIVAEIIRFGMNAGEIRTCRTRVWNLGSLVVGQGRDHCLATRAGRWASIRARPSDHGHAPGIATLLQLGVPRGRDRHRSGDLTLFRRALCQLSYPTVLRLLNRRGEWCRRYLIREIGDSGRHPRSRPKAAVLTGFEPATSGLTGRRALQTAPQDRAFVPCSEAI